MDRNPNENFGNQDAGQSGQSGFGTGGSTSGSQGYAAGAAGDAGSSGGFSSGTGGASTSSFGQESSGSQSGFAAKSGQENIADRAKSGLSNVREKAGNLKSTLADKLEAGAEKLRSQGQGGQYAGAAGTADASVTDGGQVTDKLATGMQRSAEWLREADLDNLRDGIEGQVKNHPGRTLLIALGLGYVLGKAFRK
jgi:hypothetical protein